MILSHCSLITAQAVYFVCLPLTATLVKLQSLLSLFLGLMLFHERRTYAGVLPIVQSRFSHTVVLPEKGRALFSAVGKVTSVSTFSNRERGVEVTSCTTCKSGQRNYCYYCFDYSTTLSLSLLEHLLEQVLFIFIGRNGFFLRIRSLSCLTFIYSIEGVLIRITDVDPIYICLDCVTMISVTTFYRLSENTEISCQMFFVIRPLKALNTVRRRQPEMTSEINAQPRLPKPGCSRNLAPPTTSWRSKISRSSLLKKNRTKVVGVIIKHLRDARVCSHRTGLHERG